MRNEHIKYVTKAGRFGAVRMVCTCGSSHGARTWTDLESAAKDPEIRGSVQYWFNNLNVSRICRDYAERGTGYETLRSLLKL